MVKGVLVFWERHDFDGAILVVRTEDEMIARKFYIPDDASALVRDCVDIEFASAIRL